MKNRANHKHGSFYLFGISNTGKLTDIAANTLSFRKPGLFRAIPAKKGVKSLRDAKKEGELIFVVDGCEEHCAKRNLRLQG